MQTTIDSRLKSHARMKLLKLGQRDVCSLVVVVFFFYSVHLFTCFPSLGRGYKFNRLCESLAKLHGYWYHNHTNTHTHTVTLLYKHICIIKMSSSLITRFYSFYLVLFHGLVVFFKHVHLIAIFQFGLVIHFLFLFRSWCCWQFKRVFFFCTRIKRVCWFVLLPHVCLCLVNRKPDWYLNEDLWKLFFSLPSMSSLWRVANNILCVYAFFLSSFYYFDAFAYFNVWRIFALSFSIVCIILRESHFDFVW